MGLGQTLLTILALALLGTLLLASSRNTLDQRSVIEQCSYEIEATSLATSLLERATSLAFDKATVSGTVSSPTGLTAPSLLGPEGTEADELSFNDFDDYNGFHKTVAGDSLVFKSATFNVWSKVDYVTFCADSIGAAGVQTYHKRLTVWVASSMIHDTVCYQSIYSYWYFR